MKVTCIVPAAGKGKRLESRENKAFVKLGKNEILLHTLKRIEEAPFIDSIVAVVSAGKIKACKRLVRKHNLHKVKSVVRGGKKRFDSVKNGLSEAKDAGLVIVHDGARPIVEKRILKEVFLAAKKYGASISAVPAKQTIKEIGNGFFIKGTPKRERMWEAQTPQAFKRDLLERAYRKAKDRNATDDAMLVEKLGHKVKVVKGSYRNIKITTPEDLALARILLRKVNRCA